MKKVLTIMAVCGLVACKHDPVEPTPPPPPIQEDCDLSNITFSGQIAGIVDSECAGCHSANDPSAGLSLTTYEEIQDIALSGALMSSLQETDGFSLMPQNGPPLSDCEISYFQTWINNGAPND